MKILKAVSAHWKALVVATVCMAFAFHSVQTMNALKLPDVHTPPPVKVVASTSTLPDFSGVKLASVAGTTTTIAPELRGGTATIKGKVTIAGKSASGATVLIDRFVDDKSVGTTVRTNDDGNYELSGITGGRYRIRAYRVPDATIAHSEILFLNNGDQRVVDIDLQGFSSTMVVTSGSSPAIPKVGETAVISVLVSAQAVGSDGVARRIGQGGISMTLQTGSGRSNLSGPSQVTNGSGVATWVVECNSTDGQGLSVVTENGNTYNLRVADCQSASQESTTTTPASGNSTTTATTAKALPGQSQGRANGQNR